MSPEAADNLRQDIEATLSETDFTDDLYLSIRGVGTKTFKRCAYHEAEDWLFVWTSEETFVLNREEVGDFVAIPLSESKNSFI